MPRRRPTAGGEGQDRRAGHRWGDAGGKVWRWDGAKEAATSDS